MAELRTRADLQAPAGKVGLDLIASVVVAAHHPLVQNTASAGVEAEHLQRPRALVAVSAFGLLIGLPAAAEKREHRQVAGIMHIEPLVGDLGRPKALARGSSESVGPAAHGYVARGHRLAERAAGVSRRR